MANNPSWLRERAADYLRLAAEAREVGVTNSLKELAIRYLALAKRMEDEQGTAMSIVSSSTAAGLGASENEPGDTCVSAPKWDPARKGGANY